MIAAINLPVWVVPAAGEAVLLAWLLWDDARARRRRRRQRELRRLRQRAS